MRIAMRKSVERVESSGALAPLFFEWSNVDALVLWRGESAMGADRYSGAGALNSC